MRVIFDSVPVRGIGSLPIYWIGDEEAFVWTGNVALAVRSPRGELRVPVNTPWGPISRDRLLQAVPADIINAFESLGCTRMTVVYYSDPLMPRLFGAFGQILPEEDEAFIQAFVEEETRVRSEFLSVLEARKTQETNLYRPSIWELVRKS